MNKLTLAERKAELSLTLDVLERHWKRHDANTDPNKYVPKYLLSAQSYALAQARAYITALEHEVDTLKAMVANGKET